MTLSNGVAQELWKKAAKSQGVTGTAPQPWEHGAVNPSDLTRTFASGTQAQIELHGSSMHLVVDGTPQSHVNLDDPSELRFGYIRHMGHVLDQAFDTRQPLTALHLGAGALTLPRYLEHTRPGSRQQVLELERELVDLVRSVAPLPAHASIRIRYGDARAQLDRLPAGLHHRADAIVVDLFDGPQTPAHVTTAEFFTSLARFLTPNGVVLVNVADGHDLAFARAEIATLRQVFGSVLLVSDPAVFKGRRFGNIVAVASRDRLELPGLARLAASGFPPAVVQHDEQALKWLRGANPITDAVSKPSPLSGRGTFSVKRP